ncbi:MAG: single-stranded-DNA-specific exonuclease RecJ [Rickettsiaceae bacterium]
MNFILNYSEKSVTNKLWSIKYVDEDYVSNIARNFTLNDIVSRVLSQKFENLSDIYDFLDPKIRNLLPDPFHLISMDKAVARIIEAIKNEHKIYIFADYDVDGATSSAIIKRLLNDLGIIAEIYVPDRIIEGYGPNINAIKKIKKSGCDVIITVDCGSTSHDAISAACDLDIDVIVIDHHITTELLPKALAIINPNRLDQESDYGYLAGVGVSFIFLVGLIQQLKEDNYFGQDEPPNLMQYLDLVALGTVCDVVPLVKLNRAFVHQGLKVMERRKNIGINALCKVASLNDNIRVYHLGFVLGPRINAGSRVGKSDIGANLLSTNSIQIADNLASQLDRYNEERKAVELIILEKAMNIAKAQDAQGNNVLIIIGKSWHVGVIGIIAARIKDAFDKPVAVIALDNKVGKASCRSIPGVDFGAKILEAKSLDIITSGGGHAMAAGFTVQEDKIGELQSFLLNSFSDTIKKIKEHNIRYYNADLSTKAVNLTLIDELQTLEPYGQANLEPIFKFSNLFVLKANAIQSKHISCLLSPEQNSYGKSISAIAFNAFGSNISNILLSKTPHTISVIAAIQKNTWQGVDKVQLRIIDLILEQ